MQVIRAIDSLQETSPTTQGESGRSPALATSLAVMDLPDHPLVLLTLGLDHLDLFGREESSFIVGTQKR